MEALASALLWLFSDTIYGAVAVAAAIYVVLTGLRRTFPRLPEPTFIAAPVLVVGLLTLPSLPRYQFEQDTLAKIEGRGWIRVVNKTHWASLTEPLTWLRPPLGSITIVMPNSPLNGGFREVTMQYEKAPDIAMVDPDCASSTILYSRQDQGGVFRYSTEAPVNMRDDEQRRYCEYDWSTEKEALQRETLRQMNDVPK
jgi:hypothetical protein